MRWMDDVIADLKIMKIKQWMEKMKDREQWRLVFEDGKSHCSADRMDEYVIYKKWLPLLWTALILDDEDKPSCWLLI